MESQAIAYLSAGMVVGAVATTMMFLIVAKLIGAIADRQNAMEERCANRFNLIEQRIVDSDQRTAQRLASVQGGMDRRLNYTERRVGTLERYRTPMRPL